MAWCLLLRRSEIFGNGPARLRCDCVHPSLCRRYRARLSEACLQKASLSFLIIPSMVRGINCYRYFILGQYVLLNTEAYPAQFVDKLERTQCAAQ